MFFRQAVLSFFVTTQVLLTKQKPKRPLALDAKCLWRDIDTMAVSKSLSQLSDFQPATASPCRVLHQVQGDKQEINLSGCNHNGAHNAVHTLTMNLFRGKSLFPVYRLEEAVGLLKEGGVRFSDGALRACSYKIQPKT